MAFPKDLRQRMINLMYLVLMAMLAINIDPSALQGYKTINNGMNASYNAFKTKNSATVDAIEAKAEEDNKEKQLQIAELAKRVSGVSNSMDLKIDELINEIRVTATNGKGVYVADSKDPADLIMIGQDYETGEAAAVRAKIEEVIQQYTDLVNESPLEEEEKVKLISSFALSAPTDESALSDPDNKSQLGWEEWTFQGKPAIALEAMLRQMKNDAKATEGQILEEFAKEMDADKIDIPYDTYTLAVVPSSTYVTNGERFTAKINVGLSSSQASNLTKIYADGRLLTPDSEGWATYSTSKGLGEHTFKNVYAEVTNPQTGDVTRVDLDPKDAVNYKVINPPDKPSAAVSADKMNVLYVGLDNPVSVSASGELGGVTASCSGCTSFNKNGNGGYDAKVGANSIGKEVNISVALDGQTIDTKKFRVLKVPDPDVKLGNYKPGSSISTAELARQRILRADLSNFPYETKFEIVSYDLALLKNATPFTARATGPRITSQMSDAFGKVNAGWLVVFRNIKVKGPDGQVRDIGSVTYVTK